MKTTCTNKSEGLKLWRRSKLEGGRHVVLPVQRVRLGICRVPAVMRSMVGARAVRILAEGGFVQAELRGGKWEVCMASLVAHMIAASEPGFWNAERSQRYLEARHRIIQRRRLLVVTAPGASAGIPANVPKVDANRGSLLLSLLTLAGQTRRMTADHAENTGA